MPLIAEVLDYLGPFRVFQQIQQRATGKLCLSHQTGTKRHSVPEMGCLNF